MTTAEEIVIKNVQAIKEVHVPYLPDGGLVTFLGVNGSGKTTALNAIHRLAGGKDTLTVRDGEEEGTIEGLGRRIVVTLTKPKDGGALVVDSFDGAIDPSILVDPGYSKDNPEGADMERCRILCQIAGVQPDLQRFGNIVRLDEIGPDIGTKARNAGSLPEQAKWLKKDIEELARKEEQKIGTLRASADALAASMGGIDPKEPHDEKELAATYEHVVRDLAHTEGEAKGAADRKKAYQAAKARLDEAASARAGRTSVDAQKGVETAQATVDAATVTVAASQSIVDDLADQLARARVVAAQAVTEKNLHVSALAGAQRELAAAKEAEKAMADAQAAVAAGMGDLGPSPTELGALRDAVTRASLAKDKGAVVRDAIKRQAEAMSLSSQADAIQARALSLRESAKAVWGVVARAVSELAPAGMRFADGRVYMKTDRGDELFDDLSHGERWMIAAPACVKAVKPGGILIIRQEAMEGLDPMNKRLLLAHAQAGKVTIYTAYADNGALRAEVFQP